MMSIEITDYKYVIWKVKDWSNIWGEAPRAARNRRNIDIEDFNIGTVEEDFDTLTLIP
jgi:hypothetical protein